MSVGERGESQAKGQEARNDWVTRLFAAPAVLSGTWNRAEGTQRAQEPGERSPSRKGTGVDSTRLGRRKADARFRGNAVARVGRARRLLLVRSRSHVQPSRDDCLHANAEASTFAAASPPFQKRRPRSDVLPELRSRLLWHRRPRLAFTQGVACGHD